MGTNGAKDATQTLNARLEIPSHIAPWLSSTQDYARLSSRLLSATRLIRAASILNTLGSRVTNAAGCYAFTDSTKLELIARAAGYVMMFKNTTDHPGRLASYVDYDMSHYGRGTEVHMPTIEIGEVALLSPQDKTVQAYPVTFRWLPRGDTTRYRVRITGPDYYFDTFWTYPESYTLESGNGFTPGVWYTWRIVVESNTGLGESREMRQIAFKTSLFLPLLVKRDESGEGDAVGD